MPVLPTGVFALPSLAAVQERAFATLLGAALGDALGATVEFCTPSEIRAQFGVLRKIVGGGWLKLRPGEVTDDTQMSLCIARSLAAVGWSPSDIADRFATWFKSWPIDVGNTCRRGIARYINHGTLSGSFNEGDAGNGAVMRVAPVALATLADGRLLEAWAVEQGHITHNHPLSDAACVIIGRLIHLGCTGQPFERLQRAVDESIALFPCFRISPYRGLASGYVVDTMQTVLHYFLTTHSFEECLVATVNQGGDADTTGAIAGAIAGALYGPAQLPRHWVAKLAPDLVREIQTLSEQLVARSPLGQAQPVVM
jgi:ADP-ribosyl-[dinitrogen reductase] hydrolase